MGLGWQSRVPESSRTLSTVQRSELQSRFCALLLPNGSVRVTSGFHTLISLELAVSLFSVVSSTPWPRPDVVLAPQGASVCATRPLLSARPLSRLLLASPRQPRLWVLVLLETCLLWRATSPSGPLTSLGCTFPARPCGLSPHWPLFP